MGLEGLQFTLRLTIVAARRLHSWARLRDAGIIFGSLHMHPKKKVVQFKALSN